MRCRKCAREIRPRNRPELPGIAHAGRGLCRRCYAGADLADYPPLGRGGVRSGRPAEFVLEDAEWLADVDNRRPSTTLIGLPISARRDVAARLQISTATLDKAIYRARARRAARIRAVLNRRRLELEASHMIDNLEGSHR